MKKLLLTGLLVLSTMTFAAKITTTGKSWEKIEKEYREEFSDITDYDWDEIKREIAKELDFSVDDNIAENTLMKFYEIATREPQYQSTYHEDDGSLTLSESLISRPMGERIRKNIGE